MAFTFPSRRVRVPVNARKASVSAWQDKSCTRTLKSLLVQSSTGIWFSTCLYLYFGPNVLILFFIKRQWPRPLKSLFQKEKNGRAKREESPNYLDFLPGWQNQSVCRVDKMVTQPHLSASGSPLSASSTGIFHWNLPVTWAGQGSPVHIALEPFWPPRWVHT